MPELLDENQPDIAALLDSPGLGFRYQYEVLPEGLLPRFIVQTHRHSESSSLALQSRAPGSGEPGYKTLAASAWRWRTGVVLARDGSQAVVRADLRERRVDIHITGPERPRRDLLAIIREKFDEQHRELKGLKVDERVPIPGEPGVTESYQHLLFLEEQGEEWCWPSGATRRHRVTDLLNGVEPRAARDLRRRSQSDPGSEAISEITVFISYSHDSDSHRDRVLALSERLRDDGIVTILDRYVNGSPPEGWPRWMLNGLNAATHVLCVSTETYHRRFRGAEVSGKGKGVDWEGALVTQALYDARSRSNKFVPVLFERADEPHIPDPLRGQTHYVLDTDGGYQSLYDALLGQAGVEPGSVGALKRKPRPTGRSLDFASELVSAGPVARGTSSAALTVWREKLEFLLVEEAVCASPEMKFELKHRIAEAREKVRSLGGEA